MRGRGVELGPLRDNFRYIPGTYGLQVHAPNMHRLISSDLFMMSFVTREHLLMAQAQCTLEPVSCAYFRN